MWPDRTVVDAKLRPEPMATDCVSRAEARAATIVATLAFWAAVATLVVVL